MRKLTRHSLFKELLKYLMTIILVSLIGACIIRMNGDSPLLCLQAIIAGSLGDLDAVGQTIRWLCPCILAGLASVIASQAGIMNMGIDGQLYLGAFVAAVVGYAAALPAGIHTIVALLAGMLAGMLYALVPALLRRFSKVDEMISTLMLNYVAILLTEYLTMKLIGADAATYRENIVTPPVLETAKLPELLKGTKASAGIFIALAAALFIYLWGRYTVSGYEIRQMGQNRRFAQAGGVNTTSLYFIVFLASGIIAGLCGSIETLGVHGRFRSNFSSNLGWDGIMIALVAKKHPLGVVAVSIVWSILKNGSLAMERTTNTSRLVVTVLQALFVLFVAIDYDKLLKQVLARFGSKKAVKEVAS